MAMLTNRRMLLGSLAGMGLAGSLQREAFAKDARPALKVNGDRLRQSIEGLSVYGRPKGMGFEGGASRFAYSDADVAGRGFVMDMIRSFGVTPRIDEAGNIRVRLEGTETGAKPILIGSHIDTVPSGGNFDGIVGSLASIEILRTMKENGRKFRHPLEVAIWANEEGGLVGSWIVAGRNDASSLDTMLNGIRRSDGIRRIGGDPGRLEACKVGPGAFHCYLELHIEQGGVLDKAGIPIGVVEGIVTTRSISVDVQGFANHAGTTPMNDRQDALLAAAKLVEAVREEVTREPGRQVGTIGKFDVYPNVGNVVPGEVKLNIGMRDLDGEKLERISDRIIERAKVIGEETRTEIVMSPGTKGAKAWLAAPLVQDQIEASAQGMGLRTMRMPSGATHDAGPMSTLTRMGMIFIPSVKGISHSPHEFSRWEDIAQGANVLMDTIRRMDEA